MDQDEVFQRVRENFQRLEAFGWFSPHDTRTIKFRVWPEGKSTNGLGYRQAAVLFLLSYFKGALHVLITKRSFSVSTHKGEQCLPGGNREIGDPSPVDTALREAAEEVGLDPSLVELVSVLPPFPSGWSHLNCVSPVVCLLKCPVGQLQLTPNPDEVETISWIPIRTFVESHSMKNSRGKWRGLSYVYISFTYVNPETQAVCHVWGLTGNICTTVSAITLNQLPKFPKSSYGIVNILHHGDNCVAVSVRDIAITSKHIEKWKDLRHEKLNYKIPTNRWDAIVTSKL